MTAIPGAESITARIAQRLAAAVGPQRYTMWFDRAAQFAYRNSQNRLEVTVPNRFVADWIGRHFESDLLSAARQEVGQNVDVAVQVEPDRFADAPKVGDEGGGGAAAAPLRQQQRHGAGGGRALRHELGDFIVGPCNELAFTAASRLAGSGSGTGSPLFIHGGVGLGKTHLLQGVCRKMLDDDPGAKVLYTTAEQFTNEFIAAVRTRKIDAFRAKMRRLDLLAVDDVHFIANKEKTQGEFLHCLDNIELQGARVAMASDSHPKLIEQFSEALVSRCVRGMVVQIRPPDTETRIKIVRALAERRGISLMETVVAVLAQRCGGSVREIEGLLTRLHALAHLSGGAAGEGGYGRHGMIASRSDSSAGEDRGCSTSSSRVSGQIGHALVNRLFDGDMPALGARNVRFETILEQVAEQTGVAAVEILGRSRHRHVTLARSLAIYLTREMTRMSYPEIAAATKRASHSTVIAAMTRITKQMGENKIVALPSGSEPVAIGVVVDRLRRAITRRVNDEGAAQRRVPARRATGARL